MNTDQYEYTTQKTLHRKVIICLWLALIAMLLAFPGFEVRGLAAGLIIGYWPLALSQQLLELSHRHTLAPFILMFVLSGATVGLCAWLMDIAEMKKKVLPTLACGIISGAAFLGMNGINFMEWQRIPAIQEAIHSPEVSYQPNLWDFNKTIVIPRTLAGGLWGLYVSVGACGLCAIVILLRRPLSKE
ncbi:MAG: hypothetical protein KAU94_05755 [Verrucomicrobia bacterium]|nr:hypothetical protein [Verrucomicrobiota bacterium]